MPKKWGWNALLVPLLVILNGGMLAVELVMLRAGSGSLKNPQKEPSYYPGWYAVIIDTNDYQSSQNDPPGLPDRNDASKRKDFFSLYPSLYCSGEKREHPGHDNRGNKFYSYEVDRCSPWGQQFDLQGVWRDYGVDLAQANYNSQSPRIIWGSLMTSALTTALSATLKLLGIWFFYAKAASVVLSWVSLACLCATGGASQMLVGSLVGGLHEIKVGGTGRISAQSGPIHTRASWILAAISLATALIETFMLHREYCQRRSQKHFESPTLGHGHGHGRKHVYQHLADEGHGGKDESRIELITSYASSSRTAQNTAYEPMRHH